MQGVPATSGFTRLPVFDGNRLEYAPLGFVNLKDVAAASLWFQTAKREAAFDLPPDPAPESMCRRRCPLGRWLLPKRMQGSEAENPHGRL